MGATPGPCRDRRSGLSNGAAAMSDDGNVSVTPLQSTITAVVSKSEGWYVASCREISAVTQGRTFDELVDNLREVIELHLEGDDPAEYGLTPNPSIVMTFDAGVVSAQT